MLNDEVPSTIPADPLLKTNSTNNALTLYLEQMQSIALEWDTELTALRSVILEDRSSPFIDNNIINAHFDELQGALHKLQIDVDQLRSSCLKPQVSSIVDRVKVAIDQYQRQQTSNNACVNSKHPRNSLGGGLEAQQVSSPLIPPSSINIVDSSPAVATVSTLRQHETTTPVARQKSQESFAQTPTLDQLGLSSKTLAFLTNTTFRGGDKSFVVSPVNRDSSITTPDIANNNNRSMHQNHHLTLSSSTTMSVPVAHLPRSSLLSVSTQCTIPATPSLITTENQQINLPHMDTPSSTFRYSTGNFMAPYQDNEDES